MGFPSPASDYVEERLNLNKIYVPHPGNTFKVETATGFMLVDSSTKIKNGEMVAFLMQGSPMLGKWHPRSLITEDGEAIEGEALEDVIVLGKVTVEVLTLDKESRPTI